MMNVCNPGRTTNRARVKPKSSPSRTERSREAAGQREEWMSDSRRDGTQFLRTHES